MKTIAIFSGYSLPHLGGIERYIDNLSKILIARGYRVIIISSNYNNSKSIEINNNQIFIRIPIFNIFKNRYPIPKKNKEYKRLIKILDEYNIDRIIVNTRFHLTSHIGAKYAFKHNIPIFLIEHGSNYVTLDNKFIDFFANRYEDFLTFKIKRKVTSFYGVSEAASKWLKRFNIKSSGVWYNSIDTNQMLPKKQTGRSINFLYAGRLIKQKGVQNILDAFLKLERDHKNIKLYIAGDGPEAEFYKQKYISKNIVFLGKLNYNELLSYYAKTTCFIYTPLWPEGLPTSILEAGLMKCCVIGTNQGGISEVVNDSNGYIVDGSVQSIYLSMKSVVENPKESKLKADNLHNDIETKFSWEETTTKILKDINL